MPIIPTAPNPGAIPPDPLSNFHRSEFEQYNQLSNRAARLAGSVQGWLTMHAEGSASAERALAGIRKALAEYDASRDRTGA